LDEDMRCFNPFGRSESADCGVIRIPMRQCKDLRETFHRAQRMWRKEKRDGFESVGVGRWPNLLSICHDSSRTDLVVFRISSL
jgi:hypothetical protein